MKTKRGSACFTFCFVPAASKFATKTTLTTPTTTPTPQFLSDVRSRVSRCRDDRQTSENSSFRHFPYRDCFLCFFLHRNRSRQSRCNRAEVWTFFVSDDEIFDNRRFIWKIVVVLIRKLCVCSSCIVSLNSEWNRELRTKPCSKMLAKVSFSLLTGKDKLDFGLCSPWLQWILLWTITSKLEDFEARIEPKPSTHYKALLFVAQSCKTT